jgi:hypothetical protein
MTAIPFNEQVTVFRREALKAFEYVALDDFYRAKFAIYNGDWSTENIAEVLMRANYNGALARQMYYKYVYQRGFDARALWDALILTWLTNGVWSFDFDQAIKTPEFKAVLKQFRYPKWVTFGLIGGGLDDVKRMGAEFSEEMERLKRMEDAKS